MLEGRGVQPDRRVVETRAALRGRARPGARRGAGGAEIERPTLIRATLLMATPLQESPMLAATRVSRADRADRVRGSLAVSACVLKSPILALPSELRAGADVMEVSGLRGWFRCEPAFASGRIGPRTPRSGGEATTRLHGACSTRTRPGTRSVPSRSRWRPRRAHGGRRNAWARRAAFAARKRSASHRRGMAWRSIGGRSKTCPRRASNARWPRTTRPHGGSRSPPTTRRGLAASWPTPPRPRRSIRDRCAARRCPLRVRGVGARVEPASPPAAAPAPVAPRPRRRHRRQRPHSRSAGTRPPPRRQRRARRRPSSPTRYRRPAARRRGTRTRRRTSRWRRCCRGWGWAGRASASRPAATRRSRSWRWPASARVREGTNGKVAWTRGSAAGDAATWKAPRRSRRASRRRGTRTCTRRELFAKLESATEPGPDGAALECVVATPKLGAPLRSCYDARDPPSSVTVRNARKPAGRHAFSRRHARLARGGRGQDPVREQHPARARSRRRSGSRRSPSTSRWTTRCSIRPTRRQQQPAPAKKKKSK